MRLKNAFISYIMIIILLISSIFFFLFLMGRSFLSYEYLYNISTNFNFIKYIQNNEILKDTLEEKEIPLEIFNYIDGNTINSITEEYLYDFYYKGKNNINKSKLKNAIYNSIQIYENKNTIEIAKYIESDIDSFISRVEYSLSDKIFFDEFVSIKEFLFNDFYLYISIGVLILSLIMLIVLEMKNSLIIIGTISILFSFLIYWLVNFLSFDLILSVLNLDIGNYFNHIEIFAFNNIYQKIYVYLFVLGIIFVIIYLSLNLKVLFKKIRTLFYDMMYK